MFVRSREVKGRTYFSVVESRRGPGGSIGQRHVVSLGTFGNIPDAIRATREEITRRENDAKTLPGVRGGAGGRPPVWARRRVEVAERLLPALRSRLALLQEVRVRLRAEAAARPTPPPPPPSQPVEPRVHDPRLHRAQGLCHLINRLRDIAGEVEPGVLAADFPDGLKVNLDRSLRVASDFLAGVGAAYFGPGDVMPTEHAGPPPAKPGPAQRRRRFLKNARSLSHLINQISDIASEVEPGTLVADFPDDLKANLDKSLRVASGFLAGMLAVYVPRFVRGANGGWREIVAP